MNTKIGFSVALFLFISFFTSPCVIADDDSSWYHVPVIINVADGCNADDVKIKAMIARANEIMHKAKIHFYVKETKAGYKVGNGNSTFTGQEENMAIEDGRKEIGTGRGMKITIADTISTIDNPLGIAKHRIPVALIANGPSGSDMGQTLAHEFCHCLTINDDLTDANDPNHTDNLMWKDDAYGSTKLNAEQIKEIRKQVKKHGEISIDPEAIQPKPIPPGGPPQVTYGGIRYKYHPWGVSLDDANETPVIIYEPVVVPHDIIWTEVSSGGTNDANDTVKVGILPAGLIEAFHEYLLKHTVKFDHNFDGMPDTTIEINISTYGGVVTCIGAEIKDFAGVPMGIVPVTLDTHYKFRDYGGGINAVAERDFTSIDFEIPVHQFWGFPGNTFEVPCQVMVQSEIFMADSNTSMDETAWFIVDNYSTAGFYDLAAISYIADPLPGDPVNPYQIPTYLLQGEGFVGDVEIFIDGNYAATIVADGQGKISYPITADMMTVGETFAEAVAVDGSGRRVFSYFINKEPIESDLNGDYSVDFADFAILADNWLVSVN